MRKSARIYVSQDDINKGCIKDGRNCPVWRAIKRHGILKNYVFEVESTGIDVGSNYSNLKTDALLLTDNGRDFIRTFDRQLKVKPQHITIIDPTGKYL